MAWGRFAGLFQKAVPWLEKRPARVGPAELLKDLRQTGGFSWSPLRGRRPTEGYMVALTGHTRQLPEEIVNDPEAFFREFDRYMFDNRAVFENNPDVYLGGWRHEGHLWLEPSRNVHDRSEAIRLGRETDQIDIYDVKNGTTINTGGEGGFIT